MYFDNEEEAKKEAGKHPSGPLGFCPVIKDNCRTLCVCFNDTKISPQVIGYGESQEIRHHVYPAYCSHVLIQGEIGFYQ